MATVTQTFDFDGGTFAWDELHANYDGFGGDNAGFGEYDLESQGGDGAGDTDGCIAWKPTRGATGAWSEGTRAIPAALSTWSGWGASGSITSVTASVAVKGATTTNVNTLQLTIALLDSTGATIGELVSHSGVWSGGWTTLTGSALAIPSGFRDPATQLKISIGLLAGVTKPINLDLRLDDLTLVITYDGDLQADLTEDLGLTDSFSPRLSDPTKAPPGGSGQPKVFSDGSFLDSCDPSDARATVCTRTTRTIPSDLATHLAGESLTLAYCLRLVRRDATTYGFTTCDKDLTFDPGSGSMTFEALNSLSVTALRQELGATVGNMDLAGLIRSDRVTAADLLAGRYDGAELTLYLVNWADLTQGKVTLARGWWGAVTLVDGQWKAEYRSLTQRLQQQIVEQTSPTCRVAQLGDARCKVTLADFQFARTVTAVVDNRNFTFGSDSHGSSYYAAGRVIWTAGNNNALTGEVKRSTLSAGSAVIEMQTAFPFTVQVGDTATLEAGCDRRLATCKGRFANVVNFRGEPYVPGSEILRRVKSLLVAG